MKNKKGTFRFKRFEVCHERSSMKVGVDGVLVGAWADVSGKRLLDIGTGCGIIALMLAQRNPDAEVVAIDIDPPSVEEAAFNFSLSPWGDRLQASLLSFQELCGQGERFNLIVSNPPYFDSGVTVLDDARKRARHVGSLSPESLLAGAAELLNADGRLAMVVPSEFFPSLSEAAPASGMRLSRWQFVRNHPSAPVKRVLMEFEKTDGSVSLSSSSCDEGTLVMFESGMDPTEAYRNLCGEFYLKF